MSKEDYLNLSLTSLYRIFHRINSSLLNAINGGVDTDIVRSRFDDLQKHLKIIVFKYEQEIENDRFDITDNSEQWINEIQERFDQSEIVCNEYEKKAAKDLIRDDENKRLQEKVHKSHDRCMVEKKILDNYVANMRMLLSEESSKRNFEFIERIYLEFREQFDICKNMYAKHLYLLKMDGVVVDENMDFGLNELISIFNEVRKLMEKTAKMFCGTKGTNNDNNSKLKLERMKLPTFNGQIRNYARFKSDFENYVKPKLDPSDIPFVLKSCLQGEPLETVRNLEDNSDIIWSRLNEKYGTTSKVVKSVLDDVRKHSALKDGDDISFVKFVQIIDSGLTDLRKIGLESEFSNSNVISEIENKLPPTIRREWSTDFVKGDKEMTAKEKFVKLLEFLKDQRNAIEYRVCTNLETNEQHHNHNASAFIVNHVSKDRTSEYKRIKRNRCPLHKMNTHTLDTCQIFIDAVISEKLSIVYNAKACWNCLLPGHKASNCRKPKGCVSKGCRMWHHALLHEGHVNGYTFGNKNI